MVSKKLLSAAIASAFLSVPAFAVINLDADPLVPVSFGKQTLKDNATQDSTVGAIKHYEVTGPANILDFTGKLGVGIAEADQVFIRVTLTNAVFETALVAASLEVDNVAATALSQGGAAGDAYAVFAVTAGVGGLQIADVVEVLLPDLALLGTADAGYGYQVYETLGNAINSASPLYSKSVAGTVKLVDSLTFTKTTTNATANVSDDFKMFTGGISTVLDDLGSFDVAAAAVLAADDGLAVADADVFSAGTVKVTGDFSVGTFQVDDNIACASPTSTGLTLNTAKTELSAAVGVFQADPFLCVTLPGDKVIGKGSYEATMAFTAAANAAFAQASSTNTMGSVLHNGTTIQVPYVTTFADYAQRLVLVNRGGVDSAYTITFTPEAGVTATAGAAASGTLPAGKTVIVAAKDVVSLVGATRTAATINVVAVDANIDAATTSVNLADKSTDTVKLK